MKNRTIARWLKEVYEHAADTVDLLGNHRKQERERRTCAAFLRCAGIPFTADQVISSAVEPPDVLFASARFEITIILDRNRKMHQEWKVTTKRRAKAARIEELLDAYNRFESPRGDRLDRREFTGEGTEIQRKRQSLRRSRLIGIRKPKRRIRCYQP